MGYLSEEQMDRLIARVVALKKGLPPGGSYLLVVDDERIQYKKISALRSMLQVCVFPPKVSIFRNMLGGVTIDLDNIKPNAIPIDQL
jgi:hypothetical protein